MKHLFYKYPIQTVCLLFGFVWIAGCKKNEPEILNNGNPAIFAVSPVVGRVGNKVNIKGANFAKDPKDNKVFFNGIPAVISVGIDEELLVTVPSGASTGLITVEVPGFGVVTGPVFTVDGFLQTDLYTTDRGGIRQLSFDENGQFTQRDIFNVSGLTGMTIYDFVVDTTAQEIYASNYDLGEEVTILKVDIAAGTAVKLYDTTESALPRVDLHGSRPAVVNRINIDPERRLLYAGSMNCILKGNMEGSMPLQVIYQTVPGSFILGLTFSHETNSLYWCEPAAKKVFRLSLDGAGIPEVLFDESDGLSEPRYLAIDAIGNRIFIVEDRSINDLNFQVLDKIYIGKTDGSGSLQTFMTSLYGDALNVYMGIHYDAGHKLLYWATASYTVGGLKRIVRINPSTPNPVPDLLVDRFGDYLNNLGELQYFTVGATK